MNTYAVKDIRDSAFFADNVYLDKKFLLLIPETPMTAELKEMLTNWEFDSVYSDGEPFTGSKKPSASSESAEALKMSDPNIKIAAAGSKRQAAIITRIGNSFTYFLDFVSKVYADYAEQKQLNSREIADKVKELCKFVKENEKFIMRLPMEKYNKADNYLALHSLRSTIFALIIAFHIKMPDYKIADLGIACLLHEIGMSLIPSKIYMDDKPLNEQALKALKVHPVMSFNILKNASFPLPICLGVLEHHERNNGKGYPRGLESSKISVYGKIIGIACSFEAATAIRPYKEAKDAALGIVDMMRNSEKQYDESILKALLFSMSFYPIGTYVYLSNEKYAQVIDVNPSEPRYPIVQMYNEIPPISEPKILGTDKNGITIKRILSRSETEKLLNLYPEDESEKESGE